MSSLAARLQLPPEAAQAVRGKSSPIEFEISATDLKPVREKSTFLVPR